jgi:hypothetical protein
MLDAVNMLRMDRIHIRMDRLEVAHIHIDYSMTY